MFFLTSGCISFGIVAQLLTVVGSFSIKENNLFLIYRCGNKIKRYANSATQSRKWAIECLRREYNREYKNITIKENKITNASFFSIDKPVSQAIRIYI